MRRPSSPCRDVPMFREPRGLSGGDQVRLGRRGLNRAHTSRVAMIFDAETSALLAHEQVLLETAGWIDARPGTRIAYTAYLESGRTTSPERIP